MANRKSKAVRGAVVHQRQIPWMLISGVTVVAVFAAVVFGFAFMRYSETADVRAAQEAAEKAAEPFKPSPENPDPSKKIPGVTVVDYPGQIHVRPDQRVAYDHSPPFGGPHDGIWADCTGVVYPEAVRTENMVHSLEHGAVWIAYNPEKVDEAGVERLKVRADGKPYTMMSPYPGLDSPISLQSWGHQLKLDSADDPRIDQFITALRLNNNGVYPEIGGSCQAYPGAFDTNNPPKFDGTPPGPDAVPMDGRGATQDAGEMGQP
ncbi:Protein of unknown function [Saccharopolyspora kobensis]|uniref:DUF3105 domain-containing protein n=1 Tax=Saccharopolyspora kobensis TaxID=146035 RepID=A0A1H6ENK1_9PSEU|nr:DUF3105 domain-containing protein [Saccharopolyspora kobensis]SEG98314.1 Protein of unknown function [Saccharopolyspora kobensis]SFE70408.1 Protein of unknown function [Saccharopolyspora kobensis]